MTEESVDSGSSPNGDEPRDSSDVDDIDSDPSESADDATATGDDQPATEDDSGEENNGATRGGDSTVAGEGDGVADDDDGGVTASGASKVTDNGEASADEDGGDVSDDEAADEDTTGEPIDEENGDDADGDSEDDSAADGTESGTDRPIDDEEADADDEEADADDEETDADDEETDTDDGAEDEDPEETESGEADTDSDADIDTDKPIAETDGEGYVGDRPERSNDPAYPDPDEDIGGISMPPDDQEMPLADHIEEMILRLAVVLLFGSAGTAIGLLWASEAIEFIWLNVFPLEADQVPPPHVYHPLELWLTRIKVAALLGIMVALPMFVYQCYLFMRPGLYEHERKYYLAAVPSSVILAAVGMLFSFFLVLPVLFRYFTFYANPEGEGPAYSVAIAYALAETFDLIVTLTGFLAIVFQIPLFIMLAIMMGVTTRRWLADKRLYFWAAFAGLSFMFTMDPTMMAPILVAITMILLFEGTLLLLKWAGR